MWKSLVEVFFLVIRVFSKRELFYTTPSYRNVEFHRDTKILPVMMMARKKYMKQTTFVCQ